MTQQQGLGLQRISVNENIHYFRTLELTMNRRDKQFLALLAGFLLLVGDAAALSTDREQPIRIEADQLDVDDLNGISIYRGNVRFIQGSVLINAEEVQVFTDKDRQLKRIEANGEPATFQQRLDSDNKLVQGQSKIIKYSADNDHVRFIDDAHFWQEGDEFAGSEIEYFMQQEMVKASKSESERVQVILQPRNTDAAQPSTAETSEPQKDPQ